MKKLGVICLFVCFCLLFGMAAPVAQCAEEAVVADDSVTKGSKSVDGAVPVLGNQQLIENAQAVVLYELNTQTLMYTWNPDTRVFPSSLVKIMTAMLVLEHSKLSDEVTVKQEVLDTVPYDALVIDLVAGERMNVETLLYSMMVSSANDAAAVLADYVAGSQELFVQMMNAKAAELGCRDTNFTNVHGLHNEQQYTTARDLARILAAAMEIEEFRSAFGAKNYEVPATNKAKERKFNSSNFLMNTETVEIYYDERVTGGRTGITEDGFRCLAASAASNGMELISIVMGSESTFEEDGYTTRSYGSFGETKQLLDLGFQGFRGVQVLYAGQVLRSYTVDGKQLTVGTKRAASAILPEDISSENLSYEYVNYDAELTAPINKGDKISCVRIWNGRVCVAQADLYAMHDIKVPENTVHTQTPDTETDGDTGKVIVTVIIVILCIGALALAALLVVRNVRKKAAMHRERSYRRNRRRTR